MKTMAEYWAHAQSRVDNLLLPMAIRARCFPKSTTANDLEKHINNPTGSTGKPKPTDPRLRAAEGVRLLSATCHTGFLLLKLEAQLRTGVASTAMVDDRAAVMAMIDEVFLQSHADLYSIFQEYAPKVSGYLDAIYDSSHHNAQRGAAGRRGIGGQTTGKVKEVAPKYMHLPKDTAAALIGGEIGRSASTVRRLLSELFPGSAWVR